jgi:hypothetical protein
MQQSITPAVSHEAPAIGANIAKNDNAIVIARRRRAIPRPNGTKYLSLAKNISVYKHLF